MRTFKEYADLVKKEHALNKTIAPNETGTTASRAYAVGEQFIRNGILYKVTTAIASGATWANISSSYEAASNVTAQVTSLKETLSNQVNALELYTKGKNKLVTNSASKTESGVSYVNIGDGTVICSGTQTGANAYHFLSPSVSDISVLPRIKAGGSYILTGGKSANKAVGINLYNGSNLLNQYIDDGSGVTFTIPSNCNKVAIYLYQPTSGTAQNETYQVMLRDSDISDSTWEPIYNTIKQLTKETTGLIDNQNVNGAVNELENNNVTNVQTETTFTVNPDKTVTVTVASTTSAPRSMKIPFNFKKGTYKLTGNPVKDSPYIKMTFYNHTDAQNMTTDFGYGAVFTIDGTKRCSVYIDLRTGAPAGTYVFKPMISLASLNLSYDDYVPYAKSNKELTELTKVSTKDYISTTYGIGLALTKVGHVITAQVVGDVIQAIAKNTTVYTLPEEARPYNYGLFVWITDQNTMDSSSDHSVQLLTKCFINTNGKVSTGAIVNGAKTRSQMVSYIAANDTPLS